MPVLISKNLLRLRRTKLNCEDSHSLSVSNPSPDTRGRPKSYIPVENRSMTDYLRRHMCHDYPWKGYIVDSNRYTLIIFQEIEFRAARVG